MLLSRKTLAALLIAFGAMGPGYCIVAPQQSLADEAMVLPVDPEPLVIETDAGPKSFSIELADEISERTRGLMYRQTMPDDRGMLFVFEQQGEVGFWMKNTPMPLDLLFIGQDGVIRAILPGKPFSEDTITPGEPVRFVLEFKAGTAAANGIEPGDVAAHPAINAAPSPANPG
jgi:uncharacterized membrane protein (UPF0127 family)